MPEQFGGPSEEKAPMSAAFGGSLPEFHWMSDGKVGAFSENHLSSDELVGSSHDCCPMSDEKGGSSPEKRQLARRKHAVLRAFYEILGRDCGCRTSRSGWARARGGVGFNAPGIGTCCGWAWPQPRSNQVSRSCPFAKARSEQWLAMCIKKRDAGKSRVGE